MLRNVLVFALLALSGGIVSSFAPMGALAQAAGVTGTVKGADGTPISRAVVTLSGASPSKTATSDTRGRFAFGALPAGTYIIEARASGYTSLTGRTISIRNNAASAIELVLSHAEAGSLMVIGDVTANGSATLSTTSAPSIDINAQKYAGQGVTRVSDILQNEISATVVPVIGGGLNAPAVVALRGPDPSETLVDIDGHQVNSGNTGDFDLSLVDPAELQSVQVVYGIAPSSLFGPNTLGGAVNVVTLQPTTDPHTLERFSVGSYNTFGGTLQTTGTAGSWGYAFSINRITSGGQLNNYLVPTDDGLGSAPIGNELASTSTIAKIQYGLKRDGFFAFSYQNQSTYRDLSATLSSVQTPANGAPAGVDAYCNFSASSIQSNNSVYDLDARSPIGRADPDGSFSTTAIFRHQTSFESQSVAGPGAGTSPYLYNGHDLISDDTLELDRQLPHGQLSIKVAITNENLTTDFIPGIVYADAVAIGSPSIANAIGARTAVQSAFVSSGPLDSVTNSYGGSTVLLGQTQRWMGARYTFDPTPKLHYSLAAYLSDYSSFGRSVDPRFGFVWTPSADSTLRASVGTTFQSPQLPTFIVPRILPLPVDGYVSIGNPNATAERSTEYDIGYDRLFHLPHNGVRMGIDFYRTDVHNGVATYFSPIQCEPGIDYGSNPPCLTYPVNVAREVYQGVEFRSDIALGPKTSLHLDADEDSVYTESYPPTAADDVVPYEQALGVPLHKVVLTFEHSPNTGFSYYAGVLYAGRYNELNLPPYATVRAGVTAHLRDFDIGLYGENLTDVYNFRLTQLNGGVLYGGLSGPGNGPIATDAIPLAGPRISLIFTHHL